jgi:hypothetical protein
MGHIDDLYVGIGRVAVEATAVEQAVTWFACALLQSQRAPAVLQGQGWTTVMHAALSLITEHEREAADEIDEQWRLEVFAEVKDALKRANTLMDDRASVVHGMWVLDFATGTPINRSTLVRRWGKRKSSEWTLEQMDALAYEFRVIVGLLVDKAEMLLGEPPPLE